MNKMNRNVKTGLVAAGIISALTIGHAVASEKAYIIVSDSNEDILHIHDNSEADTLKRLIARRDESTLLRMVSDGLDVNKQYPGDGTLLIMTSRNGDNALTKTLILEGADVNLETIGDGNPLIAAAANNQIQTARLLIDEGANVNAVVEHDETPLINAAMQNNYEMVKLLVEEGADVNLGVHVKTFKGDEYRSPLNQASDTIVRNYLIKMGASE